MAKSSSKFTLTDLLNQRSKEIAPMTQQEQDKGTAQDGATTKEDIYNLIPSKDNFYSVNDVQDLKQSIELLGILQPLLVTDEEDGKRRIIAGHRRRLAIMQLVDEGKERFRYVPIMVTQKKNAILDRLALIMTNRFREKTDWEKMTESIETEKLVQELKEQMDIPGRTRDLLAEIIETSPAQLGRYKAIYNNLTAELMAEFKAGKIGVSVIYEISQLEKEWQQTALEVFRENGTLALPDIKEIKKKREAAQQVPGQIDIEGISGQQDTQEAPQTDENTEGEEITEEDEETAEQRYNEEQAKIDAETRKKLRERQQEETMQQGPAEKQREEIQLSPSRYNEITSGALSFLLLKKDGFKVGEELTLPEYAAGKRTGRTLEIKVSYVMEDWTGLDDDYCIIGFQIMSYTPAAAVAADGADQPTLQPGA